MRKTQKQPLASEEKAENDRGKKAQARQGPHPVEWVIGGVSAALVLLMIGFVLYGALTAQTTQAEFEIAIERVDETDAGNYRVAFRTVNRADSTAAGVEITGELSVGDQTMETHSVTLDYVPAHSSRSGTLLFENDPREAELHLMVVGHRDP